MANYCAVAEQYARDVTSGEIPASKWIRLACQRHLDDLTWQDDDDFKFRFDEAAANKVCAFIELMPHTKGKWAAKRETLKLEPWQVFFVCCAFGWMRRKDNTRRFRRVLLLVPRKNGKSALAAAIGLYMLCADGEHGAEVYSGATTEKQAWEVFRPARLMAQKRPDMCSHYGLGVNASNLHILGNESRFEPLIGKPGDGASPSCAIVDEYHEHDTDQMFDTMETGMGAREQPMMLVITTAGDNIAGPCYLMQEEAQRMLEGTAEDDSTLALIYGIDSAEHFVNVQSYHALRELDKECKKRDVQITLTERLIAEVFAKHAIRSGTETTTRSHVGTIPTGGHAQEDCVAPVTKRSSRSGSRNTAKNKTDTPESGRKKTLRSARLPAISGEKNQATKENLQLIEDALNMGLAKKNSPECLKRALEDAKSVVLSQSTYALIIATIAGVSEDYSVGHATLQLVFWEITKEVWKQHSAIFEAAGIQIGERSLNVKKPPDDWQDPDVLRKANPNFDVSVSADFLLNRQREALASPRKAGVFKTKHLNVWVQSRDAYFNVARYMEIKDESLSLDQFEGQECIIGVDLAEKRDLTAVELLFQHQGGYARFGKFYAPEETIEQPENEHYRLWRDTGRLIQIDGAVTDQKIIFDDVIDMLSQFDVREIAFDPWHSRQMAVDLMEHGANCVEYRNSPSLMNEPMRAMDALIADGKFHHDGDPAFTWMLSNVVNGSRNSDLHRPAKERGENKIDGPVAAMMALGRWLMDEAADAPTPWDVDPEFSMVN